MVVVLVLALLVPLTVVAAEVPTQVDIPAGELISGLDLLSRQIPVDLIYDPRQVKSLHTEGLKGKYFAADVVRLLLRGTKLDLCIDPSGALLIVASPVHTTLAVGDVPPPRSSDFGQGGITTASRPQEHADSGALQEIIVTATKQAEPLSKVPVSISAYNQQTLDLVGAKTMADIAAVSPGVDFNTDWFAGSLTNIAIRGIRPALGTAATTALYIDDTPVQTRITGNSSFGNAYPLVFDLDRVEVLRGPQGTLFGSGAEAGAVRFITPDPSLNTYSEYSRAEASGTQYGAPSYEAGGAIGGPIVDNTLGFRLSAWTRHDGGWVDRQDYETGVVDSNANYHNSVVARFALAYAPVDGVMISPSVYYQSVNVHDTGEYWVNESNPSQGKFIDGNIIRSPAGDRFTLPALKITADLPFAQFTSISSYFYRNGNGIQDGTTFESEIWAGNPYPTLPGQFSAQINSQNQNILTQEFRLTSAPSDSPLSWVAGLFYSDSRQTDTTLVEDLFLPQLIFNSYGLTMQQFFGSGLLDGKYDLTGDDHSSEKQAAAYGHVNYNLLTDLKLGVGLRVARTDFQYFEVDNGPVLGGLSSYGGSQKATPVTPEVNLNYQVTPDDMLYGTVAEGYRVGGFNGVIPLSPPCAASLADLGLGKAPSSYDSDTVWNYEVGSKAKLFNGRAAIDLSMFYDQWRNIQQFVALPACGDLGFISNLGTAVSKGFDLSVEALIVGGLKMGVAVGYTDAYYTKTLSAGSSVIVSRGDTLGNTPWIVTTTAEYDIPFDGHRFYVRAQDKFHNHNGGSFPGDNPQSISYDPTIPLPPSTNVVDVRAGVVWDGVDVSLFANNVFDCHTWTNLAHSLPSDPLYFSATFVPRTVGITLTYHH
jgi:iron complex outermembrane receptor protein